MTEPSPTDEATHAEEARAHPEAPAANGVTSAPDPATTDAADAVALAAFVADLEERAFELELRLRERVEESQVLDMEVRSLQTDLRIRDEFVATLEHRITDQERLEARVRRAEDEAEHLRGELAAKVAEIGRYRARRIVRHVDRAASSIRRRPLLWRTLRAAHRALR